MWDVVGDQIHCIGIHNLYVSFSRTSNSKCLLVEVDVGLSLLRVACLIGDIAWLVR